MPCYMMRMRMKLIGSPGSYYHWAYWDKIVSTLCAATCSVRPLQVCFQTSFYVFGVSKDSRPRRQLGADS